MPAATADVLEQPVVEFATIGAAKLSEAVPMVSLLAHVTDPSY